VYSGNEFECEVSGEATLYPGGDGEVTSLDFNPAKCKGYGEFEHCELESGGAVGSWPLWADEGGKTRLRNFSITAQFNPECLPGSDEVNTEATEDWHPVVKTNQQGGITSITLTGPAETSTGYEVEYESGALGVSPSGQYSVAALAGPGVLTETAWWAVGATEATLHASVNPRGLATTYQFEYGTTTAYGSKAPASAKSAGSGSAAVEVSQLVEGLKPSTTYHFRVKATSSAGTTYGADKTLTTLPLPEASTSAATSVKAERATLNGTVNPKGSSTAYYFQYGKTTAYGTQVPLSPKSIGSGSGAVAVSETVSGLAQGTTYHYRVVAKRAGETQVVGGGDREFTTTTMHWTKEGKALTSPAELGISGWVAFESLGMGIVCEAEGSVTLEPGNTGGVTETSVNAEGCEGFGMLEECEEVEIVETNASPESPLDLWAGEGKVVVEGLEVDDWNFIYPNCFEGHIRVDFPSITLTPTTNGKGGIVFLETTVGSAPGEAQFFENDFSFEAEGQAYLDLDEPGVYGIG